jgi:hypothetical protein
MKPTDKAVLGTVSESPGHNVSEPSGGLDRNKPEGRTLWFWVKAAAEGGKLAGASSHFGGW